MLINETMKNTQYSEFPTQESVQIKEATEMESDAEEKRRRCTKSEVWGTDPIRWSK